MPDADLEFGLTWRPGGKTRASNAPSAAVIDADPVDTGELEVSLRLEIRDENVDRQLPQVPPLSMDLASLRNLADDEAAYARALTDMVLRVDDVRPFVQEALALSEHGETTLHLRLHINAPPQFHALRWECLRDPRSGDPLATKDNVLVSRYLTSPDWRPIPAVPKHALRAIVAVAGPEDIEKLSPNGRALTAVDVEQELVRARAALDGHATVRDLARGQATLAGMVAELEKGIDILYLVCHGALIDGVPILYLETPEGTTDRVDGRKLVERITALPRRPAVAMLCSCQSATGGGEQWTADAGELSALGPRLAGAGVCAVIAMQGNVTMRTAGVFAPAFFEALAEHGIVDRAMAAARRAVRGYPDWWVPVLFSRLRSGSTYYRPGFRDQADNVWETLKLQMRHGSFTPVLGPGLADSILGSRQDIAARWVQRWHMPLATHSQRDLVQVAQFLRVRSAVATVRTQLIDYLGEEIERRSADAEVGDPFYDLLMDRQSPGKTINELGRRIRQADSGDPYRVMAALPVSVYVTTAWTDLLQEALRDREPPREPVTMTFPWGSQASDVAGIAHLEAPSVDRPLVYHLFGRLDQPRSLVLTEDDYFQWMGAWMSRRKDIPSDIQSALVEKSLMFVGFRLDDWDFRVVFNAVKSFAGSEELFKENLHVGVQLSPENQLIEPEAAQWYLESRFRTQQVNIFWGETRRFVDELVSRTGLQT